jgi:hypothetical protein
MNDYTFRLKQAILQSTTGHWLFLLYRRLKRYLTEMTFDIQQINVAFLGNRKVKLVRNYLHYLPINTAFIYYNYVYTLFKINIG